MKARIFWLFALLLWAAGASVLIAPAFAQTNTPTATATATNTPTNTPTVTPVAKLATPLPTATPDLAHPGILYEGSKVARGALRVVDGSVAVSPPANGGNAGARNQFIGVPKIKLKSLGTMTNGTTETTSYLDDSPTGEWLADPNDGTVTLSADTSIYRIGSTSLKIAFSAAAAANAAAKVDIVNDSLASNESIGFWIYTSEDTSDGDLVLETRDTSDGTTFGIPGVKANRWTWVELDISPLDGTTGNVVDLIYVKLSSQGASAHAAFSVYLDEMFKWDATDEEAIGCDVPLDGILSVVTVPTTPATANTPADLAEGTDFLVAYRGGNDSIVTITDQSAASGVAMVACQ